MCFHLTFSKMKEYIESRFGTGLDEVDDLQPVYHASGFKLPRYPVIKGSDPELEIMRWGLVPHWVKDEEKARSIRMRTLNARSETVFEKPSFRGAIGSKRCLVPVDGFFEFKDVGGSKIPFLIRFREGEPFSLGGIYDEWTSPDGVKRTFSIITTDANPLMREIHNTKFRMPLMIPEDLGSVWTDPELDKEGIRELMVPFDDCDMSAYPVSKLLNKRGSDTNVPGILERVDHPELHVSSLDDFL